ncbi:putative porin [Bizionia sediminis]|uniref:Porin n=1 Tax=Bizionia sediminis TaxID=1737064 RepID=A0ABW5KTQ2_9FLAO
MSKIILTIFLVLCVNLVSGQTKPRIERANTNRDINSENPNQFNNKSSESTRIDDIKNLDAKIEQYLIISPENDTTYVDTTLTIFKEYKFNYLRRDNFELLPFSNVGQTYNALSFNYQKNTLMPLFGARARHYNYMEIADINYYHVPTPFTELYYKTAFKQGQQLDAFFTVNTSKQFNFSIAYKGLRSLGKYQHILTSTGNFRFTTSYKTKNNRYFLNAHVVMQDLLNQENGGIRDDNVPFFESGNPEFLDRAVLAVNFEDAENILKGKRFHLDHTYHLTKETDSLSKNNIGINHIISFEDKYYEYNQDRQNDYFGNAFQTVNLRDRVTLENFYSQVGLQYSNHLLGAVNVNLGYTNYNYGYDRVTLINNQLITNRLKGDVVSVNGQYEKTIKGFQLRAKAGLNVLGDFNGNYLEADASFKVNNNLQVGATASHNSSAPNYNFLLYQSTYKNYNWQTSFNNVDTQQLELYVTSRLFGNVSANVTNIIDYAYFRKDDTGSVKPFQTSNSIQYIKVKWEKGFNFLKRFSLQNTMMYQHVQDNNAILNLPKFTTRNTLLYTNRFFKKALFLQTGVTFSYFTDYYMDAYDPLLAEFYVQNNRQYGNFPRIDFFVNAKISQTRIYLKAEHLNSAWTGYNYYAAPNYPYRDFALRFGVVWNFFM